jgi:hypothetical protein
VGNESKYRTDAQWARKSGSKPTEGGERRVGRISRCWEGRNALKGHNMSYEVKDDETDGTRATMGLGKGN